MIDAQAREFLRAVTAEPDRAVGLVAEVASRLGWERRKAYRIKVVIQNGVRDEAWYLTGAGTGHYQPDVNKARIFVTLASLRSWISAASAVYLYALSAQGMVRAAEIEEVETTVRVCRTTPLAEVQKLYLTKENQQ